MTNKEKSSWLDPNSIKRGDVIIVSNYSTFTDEAKRVFVSYIDGASYPYICVTQCTEGHFYRKETFDITAWRHAKAKV